MKSVIFTVAITALTSVTLAAPASLRLTTRQSCDASTDPSFDSVESAITTWLTDVQNVNAFLDMTPDGSSAYQSAAAAALTFASNEPVQLGVLSQICELNSASDSDYQGAVTLLQEVFGNVPTDLQDIINNFENIGQVNTDLQEIDAVRCCNVLPALVSLPLNVSN